MKKVKPNKDFYGDDCWECKYMVEKGKTQAEIDEDHENCHDWNHCGRECCGECIFCGK
jgi:hypothetical protein